MKRILAAVLAVLAVTLGSTTPAMAMDDMSRRNVPPELSVPEGYVRVLESVGIGVQIYDCVDAAWKFREPAAGIFDERSERVVAIHYAGPTWQSIRDGSKVVAAVKTRRDAPNPQRDIPWLLLQSASNTGPGMYADVEYIQRLDTDGGVAPAGVCTTGASVSVPYRATYAFWAPAT
jgi:hypothetical protein